MFTLDFAGKGQLQLLQFSALNSGRLFVVLDVERQVPITHFFVRNQQSSFLAYFVIQCLLALYRRGLWQI